MSDSHSDPTTADVETHGHTGPKEPLFKRIRDSFRRAEFDSTGRRFDDDPKAGGGAEATAYVSEASEKDRDIEKKGDGGVRTGEVVVDGDNSDDNGGLRRDLSGRHLQMIALGGAIGTGLFVGSGGALHNGGPASLIIGFTLVGFMLFTVVNALGELATVFPIQGSFSIYSTRFIHPSWGFAMGWNYVMSWIVTLPTELSAAVIVINYWQPNYTPAAWVTLLLGWTFLVNMLGVRGYGESEVIYSMVKIIAIIGFIFAAIVINCGGAPDNHYYGTHTWYVPGAFNNGFHGFCSVFVTAAFAFSGTELVGLAAAETANPRKVLPSATKQVFWRVTFFYIVSLLLVSFLVGYDNEQLLNGTGSAASPFVIALQQAQIKYLPSIFNAAILIAVLSVANSSTFATSRTLTALANYNQAPKIFKFVDRQGRPMAALLLVLLFGCIGYVTLSSSSTDVFNWLLAISGLSVIFTWMSVCLAHIRFRQAWKANGRTLEELPFRAQFGVAGSWFGAGFNAIILVAQFYVSIFPIGADPSAVAFFQGYLSGVVVIALVLVHMAWLAWHGTLNLRILSLDEIDIHTGRRNFPSLETLRRERAEVAAKKPLARFYHMLC